MFSNSMNVNINETDFLVAKKNLVGFDVVLILDYYFKESINRFLIQDLIWNKINETDIVNHFASPCDNNNNKKKLLLNSTNLRLLEKRNFFDLKLYQYAKKLVTMRLQCKKHSCL